MDFGTILGFIVGTISVFGIACRWEVGSYFDTPSVGLVFGGCLTAILISVPFDKLKKMPRTFLRAFRSPGAATDENPEEIIKKLIQYSEVARRDGILALEGVLEQIPDPFLRQGLQLAVDGTDPEIITEVMNTTVDGVERRHDDNRRGWELCRGAAPSWGAMGTVIGLVQMVKGGVEDPNALITGVAVALLTTFYGSLISSWFVGPVCDKLAERSADEILRKTIITKGVLSIQNGDNPRIVEQKLRVFMQSGVAKKEE